MAGLITYPRTVGGDQRSRREALLLRLIRELEYALTAGSISDILFLVEQLGWDNLSPALKEKLYYVLAIALKGQHNSFVKNVPTDVALIKSTIFLAFNLYRVTDDSRASEDSDDLFGTFEEFLNDKVGEELLSPLEIAMPKHQYLEPSGFKVYDCVVITTVVEKNENITIARLIACADSKKQNELLQVVDSENIFMMERPEPQELERDEFEEHEISIVFDEFIAALNRGDISAALALADKAGLASLPSELKSKFYYLATSVQEKKYISETPESLQCILDQIDYLNNPNTQLPNQVTQIRFNIIVEGILLHAFNEKNHKHLSLIIMPFLALVESSAIYSFAFPDKLSLVLRFYLVQVCLTQCLETKKALTRNLKIHYQALPSDISKEHIDIHYFYTLLFGNNSFLNELTRDDGFRYVPQEAIQKLVKIYK